MGLLGISLIVASLVAFCICPQPWLDLARPLWAWRRAPQPPGITEKGEEKEPTKDHTIRTSQSKQITEASGHTPTPSMPSSTATPALSKADRDRAAMPPPPPPPPIIRMQVDEPKEEDAGEEEEATTPKAVPHSGPTANGAIPVFSLSAAGGDADSDSGSDAEPENSMPPPMFPSPFSAQRAASSADPPRATALASVAAASAAATLTMAPPSSAPGLMAPPPLPQSRRPPTLNPVSRGNLPLPNRGPLPPGRAPPSSSSSLAPPPSTTVRAPAAAKPSRKVLLAPGHSPLDWACLSSDPAANLRNLPPSAPALLRVPPSLLKQMNGRKGKDAWTALGGMVYNITPYVPFHPGGKGELLRCAGKDGTRLFQEVHGWVNYDNMLAACRVGLLVEEHAPRTSPMEEMD